MRKGFLIILFITAFASIFGQHSVWQFWNSREKEINHHDRYWTEAINRPDDFQAGMRSFSLNKVNL